MKKLFLTVLVAILIFAITACRNSETINENKLVDADSENDLVEEKILVGVMDDYPPYIVSEKNEVTGPYIDIISAVLDNLGYDYEFVILPWSRLLSAVETGEVDLAFPLYDNVERRKFFYYSEEPIGFSQMNVFGLQGSDAEYDGNLSLLSDDLIGVVQDYFYSTEFEQSINEGVITTDTAITSDKNIEKLIQGRVDLIVEDFVVVKEYERMNNLDQKLIALEQPITRDYNHIVFTKSKNVSELRRSIDQELRKIKNDGTLDDIFYAYDMAYYGEAFKLLETTYPPPKKFIQDETNTPIRIGILGDTKPYAYYENDELTGFGVEFITEVLSRIGVEYELIDIPFSRMLEELKNGSMDIGTDLYLKPDREEFVQYPALPYAAYPTVIFKKADNDLNFTGNLEELASYSIGYIRDYYIGPLDEYKDQFDFVATASPEQNIENLVNDRVDIIIDIKSTGEHIINEMNLSDEIVAVEPAIYYDYSYVVFSKESNLSNLVYEYEATVQTMFEDGTIERLSEKYGLPYLEFEELN
jgi:polar amino acid transport system substrate-binding protein